jgi:hypothetical protein
LDQSIFEASENKTGGFSGARWTPQTDICGFASILVEVVIGRPMNGETLVPSTVPAFVSHIIEGGRWSESERPCSFCDIYRIQKENNFEIVDCVDSAEVLSFVRWVESAENPGQ